MNPCDILMSYKFSWANYVMRLKWNEEYHPRIIETTKICYQILMGIVIENWMDEMVIIKDQNPLFRPYDG
jgi:hypothetical protein